MILGWLVWDELAWWACDGDLSDTHCGGECRRGHLFMVKRPLPEAWVKSREQLEVIEYAQTPLLFKQRRVWMGKKRLSRLWDYIVI